LLQQLQPIQEVNCKHDEACKLQLHNMGHAENKPPILNT